MDLPSESVKQIVSKVAQNLGYRKHLNSNWSKNYPDVIHVIGLQKSRWGLQNHLEAAIWLKSFGPAESQKFYECPVQLRLDSDAGFEAGDVDSALNEEDYWRTDPEERLKIISTTLKRADAEFFGSATNLDELRDLIVSNHKFTLAINKCVKNFFNIPLPR